MIIDKLDLSQKKLLIDLISEIIINDKTRDATINDVLKMIICESIFLKEYGILQKLSDNKLI